MKKEQTDLDLWKLEDMGECEEEVEREIGEEKGKEMWREKWKWIGFKHQHNVNTIAGPFTSV